ncbi:hypothetical protein KVR01_011406 [Diaporthe batatas]|uniref:uncharacterized protein n=1 Tax=Diaporthe batatas TaxID=748121 RepID=UPI001D04C80E|nr:uncharacterized protein KVR01_011406 [Diaporthe batatas]KAG8158963.1 hypothetical protein KVR01_011406 [Diaporthe batatas]
MGNDQNVQATKEQPSSVPSDKVSIRQAKVVSERGADETLQLLEEHGDKVGELTPELEGKLKSKIRNHILTLVIVIDLMLYIDKSTLSYAALLGIYEETGIDNTQYNNLNTLFYAGYMVAQIPGHYLMQKLPLGRFVTISVFLWSVVVFLHCTAKSYGGLIPLRFFLGFFESCLVPAMEVTMGMFFTPAEAVRYQPLFFTSCLASPIPAGFIAYGLLHIQSQDVLPWKFFMIITGGITLLIAVYTFFFYPDNPARASFLTIDERVHAIRRIHAATKSSIEQKTVKRSQISETLRDPVSWLFVVTALANQLSNNLAYQQNLLFLAIGVDTLGSTLVSAAGGAFAVVCAVCAFLLLRFLPGRTALWGAFWSMFSVAGGIGMVAIRWTERLPLLACMLLAGSTFGITYIIALGWNTATAGGYTKKLTRNVMWMVGYSVANLVSPQIWVEKDGPRYYGAWITQIVVSWVGAPLCMFAIHLILSRRNKERRSWISEQEALGYRPVGMVQVERDGATVEVEVDVSLLDLTDLENKYFLYQL